jgi:hypothetical protein
MLSFPSVPQGCVEHTFPSESCRDVAPEYAKRVCPDVVGAAGGG